MHRLVAGKRAQRRRGGVFLEHLPEPLGPHAGQRVLGDDASLNPHDVGGFVAPIRNLPFHRPESQFFAMRSARAVLFTCDTLHASDTVLRIGSVWRNVWTDTLDG